MNKMKKMIMVSVISGVFLSGCSTMSERDKRAGSIAVGALAGAMLANQVSNNPIAKVAGSVAGGLLANEIYKSSKESFKGDEDVKVEETEFNGQKAINLSIRNIHFENNSAVLHAEDRYRLKKIVPILKGKNVKIIIVGHTDSVGSSEYNMKLSLARARTVQYFLAANGIDYRKIAIQGMGETMPVASNDTAEGRAKNRRVEIYVIPLE